MKKDASLPPCGGSYLRQHDGSLVRTDGLSAESPESPQAEPADAVDQAPANQPDDTLTKD